MYPIKCLILFLIINGQSCNTQANKINGLSYVASRDTIIQSHIQPVVNLNANYAAVMPFGFIKDLANPNIVFDMERQWFGETQSGAKHYIERLQENNIKIMLKPQIWVWRGKFTGLIEMQEEKDWSILESAYSKFILTYAQLAQETNVDIFCIGTELEKFINCRPDYWEGLIINIKKVYKGKLTYAANWDEYKRTGFWWLLDYIGIDAYFPISDSKTPSIQYCLEGWKLYKFEIYELSKQYNKPILFTEYGYRSVDYSGKAPWKSDNNMSLVNLEAQTNATRALFDSFWHEEWFVGGFIWKWFHNHEQAGGTRDSRFTPQNKPVENVIRKQYSLK
jgi:hypothetical protein